jgi:hypothetical protein
MSDDVTRILSAIDGDDPRAAAATGRDHRGFALVAPDLGEERHGVVRARGRRAEAREAVAPGALPDAQERLHLVCAPREEPHRVADRHRIFERAELAAGARLVAGAGDEPDAATLADEDAFRRFLVEEGVEDRAPARDRRRTTTRAPPRQSTIIPSQATAPSRRARRPRRRVE